MTVNPRRRWLCRSLVAMAALIALWPVRLLAAPEPKIAALLDRMTAAVLAGDIEGYLACVSRADPIFWKEQQNWAADFKRHVPAAFSLTVAPDDQAVEDASVLTRLTMTWTMAAPGSRERQVAFPARFVEQDGQWLYAGEHWEILEQEGVKVSFAKGLGEVARRVADLLPEVRTHVDEGFGIRIQRVQEVKLYATMRHLQQSIYLSYTDGLSGWNEPGESIKLVVGRRADESSLKPLLAHEYGHVATFELGPQANDMPWWILEGVAELAAERYGSAGAVRSIVRSWAARGRLVPWERLADFHTVAGEDQPHVYTQGHHMLGYISEQFGREGRNAWLAAMSNGKTLDQATRQVMGMDFADLDAQWRRSLEDQRSEHGVD